MASDDDLVEVSKKLRAKAKEAERASATLRRQARDSDMIEARLNGATCEEAAEIGGVSKSRAHQVTTKDQKYWGPVKGYTDPTSNG